MIVVDGGLPHTLIHNNQDSGIVQQNGGKSFIALTHCNLDMSEVEAESTVFVKYHNGKPYIVGYKEEL